MTNFSDAAQAIFFAYWDDAPLEAGVQYSIAAVLRAAADQVVPQTEVKPQQDLKSRREAMEWGMNNQTQLTRHQLFAIAAELEQS